jgi:hypothetical protein
MTGDFMERLRAARQAIWEEDSREIKEMLDRSQGYRDTWGSIFFPTLYGWHQTICAQSMLSTVRRTLIAEELDLETVKRTLKAQLVSTVTILKWGNLPDTAQLFQEASEAMMELTAQDELIEFLEELILYTGRLNYRIEPLMPWSEIIQAFDGARP